jgi:hypothetical protein
MDVDPVDDSVVEYKKAKGRSAIAIDNQNVQGDGGRGIGVGFNQKNAKGNGEGRVGERMERVVPNLSGSYRPAARPKGVPQHSHQNVSTE